MEKELTRLILKAQNAHEEILLEVIDYSPGTQYGYDTKCPPELQKRWCSYLIAYLRWSRSLSRVCGSLTALLLLLLIHFVSSSGNELPIMSKQKITLDFLIFL